MNMDQLKDKIRNVPDFPKAGINFFDITTLLKDPLGLQATIDALKKTGTRFISDEIKIGAGGHLYVFVHPSSAGGVLLELVMDAPSGV